MTEFEREERYWVVKFKDLSDEQRVDLGNYMVSERILTRECVVVESDWPIYEETWENVQRISEGRPSIRDERDALAAYGARLTRLWMDMDDCEAGSDEQLMLIAEMHDAIRDHYNDATTFLARREAQVKMEGAASFKAELLSAFRTFAHPHIEGVFAVWERRQVEGETNSHDDS